MVMIKPEWFLDTMNKALHTGRYPDPWKIAQFVLIPKPGKQDYAEPCAYRPLCMSDVPGKLLEQMIARRVKDHLESNNLLSKSQNGFREGHSKTIKKIGKEENAKKNKGLLHTSDSRR